LTGLPEPGGGGVGGVAGESYVTAGLPGIGGVLKQRSSDFLVEEEPLYQPTGAGEHVYLFVEKEGLATLEVARLLARHFGVETGAVGFAGLKDKLAITRQVFSIHVPGRKPEDFPMLQHEQVRVLWADLHANKLRRGHLAGNRFSIKVRGVEMSRVIAAKRVLDGLEKTGIANRFGTQRFGTSGRNHVIGGAIVRGDGEGVVRALLCPVPGLVDTRQIEARGCFEQGDFAGALRAMPRGQRAERLVLERLARGESMAKAWRGIPRPEQSFFLSAWQSGIFNALVEARLRSGRLGELAEGDLAFKHDSRAVFAVYAGVIDDAATRERLAKIEISPSGPMWGVKMTRAKGAADAEEVAALEASAVTLAMLEAYERGRGGGMLEGERRPYRVAVRDIQVEGGIDEHGPYVRCAFDLPRGAFATEVMREVMKPTGGSNESAEAQD
jgi:tRNA pseudouridine13 synthase